MNIVHIVGHSCGVRRIDDRRTGERRQSNLREQSPKTIPSSLLRFSLPSQSSWSVMIHLAIELIREVGVEGGDEDKIKLVYAWKAEAVTTEQEGDCLLCRPGAIMVELTQNA